MTLRLATFNVENLFERAKALNTTTWAEGQPVLQAFERFNTLANNAVYSQADKQAMLEALETLQILQRRTFRSWRRVVGRGSAGSSCSPRPSMRPLSG